MSRTVYYRITFLFLFSFSILSAELLRPTAGGEEKEILKIAGKRRLYTVVKEEAVVYQVHIVLPLMMKIQLALATTTRSRSLSVQFSIPVIIIPIPEIISSM